MAKGAESKSIIFDKLLATFNGSFMQDDKILRIPMTENGEIVEIKVTLTAAKDILGEGTVSTVPDREKSAFEVEPVATVKNTVESCALTEDETQNIMDLAKILNF